MPFIYEMCRRTIDSRVASQLRLHSNEKITRLGRRPRQLPLDWGIWKPFLVASLLTVSSIVPQTLAAPLSGPNFNDDSGFDSGLQALSDTHWDISVNRYQIRENAPGVDGIDSGRLEDFYLQLFN